MEREVDWELAAKLTLQDYLLQILVATGFATQSDGAARVAALRTNVLKGMLWSANSATLTETEREEFQVNAQAVTARMFDQIEQRRSEIASCNVHDGK